ncbi:MAG: hypothetical protein ACPG7F_05665 [Aggregatilineales bacterium]
MLQFIQSILLSEYLIIFVLLLIFAGLTNWALRQLREYIGYALGFLVALFFIVIYSSLGLEVLSSEAEATLNVFQVICSAGFGFLVGGLTLFLLRMLQGLQGARTSMMVAFFTALNVSLIFLMFVQGPIAKRMIGIFALAFAIAALFTLALLQGRNKMKVQSYGAQGVPPGQATEDYLTPQNQQPPAGSSRLDDIRRRMQDNNDGF